jgi:hypothetical protein
MGEEDGPSALSDHNDKRKRVTRLGHKPRSYEPNEQELTHEDSA